MLRDTVLISCPTCGSVRLPATDVELWVGPGGGSYLFSCRCGGYYVKHCTLKIAALLATVARTHKVVPEQHEGPPITGDEVLDVIAALQHPGWERELI